MSKLRVGELIDILKSYPEDTKIQFLIPSIDEYGDFNGYYKELKWIEYGPNGNKFAITLDPSKIQEQIESLRSQINSLKSDVYGLERQVRDLED